MIAEAPTRSAWTFPNTTAEYAGHLSPSQIIEFLRCGECFRLNRVEHLPRPLSVNLPLGSAVHRAVQVARSGSGSGLDAAIQAAADSFEKECQQPTDEESGQPLGDVVEIDLGSKYESLGKAKDHAVQLAEFVVPRLLALDAKRGKLCATEWNLSALDLQPWPFRVEGRLDALYVDFLADASNPGSATLMADLKTSRTQEAPDEYTALAQSIYREFWLARERPLVVLADVASKGRAPDLQTYSLQSDDYGRQFTYQTVLQVAADISAGRFRPHPGWWCSYVHGYPTFEVAVTGFA